MKAYFDKYYQSVLTELGPDYLGPSGWLNYDSAQLDLASCAYSNFNKVKIKSQVKNYVLINTGSYHPFHAGHQNMMTQAIKHFERLNKYVCCAVISPSHQQYLKQKLGSKFQCDELRQYIINKELQHYPKIIADYWALNQKVETNFTDVCEHVIKALSRVKRVPETKLQFVYVFGSDNADFCHAFIKDGLCICMARPGFEDKYEKMKSFYQLSDRHFFIDNDQVDIASRATNNKLIEPELPTGVYFLRDDSVLYPHVFTKKSLGIFKREFVELLRTVLPSNVPITVMDARDQIKLVAAKYANTAYLNLDPVCYEHINKLSRNFSITRVFCLNDSQLKPLYVRTRPEDKRSSHMQYIPKKEIYAILDDDIATGTTFNTVKSLANARKTKITGAISLLAEYAPKDMPVLDVIDLRDFLPLVHGAVLPYSGLTIKDNFGNIYRIPYWDPKIDLYTRASIPHKFHQYFRQELLRLHSQLVIQPKHKTFRN